MTPLNSIMTNSGLIKKRLIKLYSEKQGLQLGSLLRENINEELINKVIQNSDEARHSLMFILSVE